jgi:hypothetical protein
VVRNRYGWSKSSYGQGVIKRHQTIQYYSNRFEYWSNAEAFALHVLPTLMILK